MIEVLSVASEVYPLVKTGGLADVVGALPEAMAGNDVVMRTLIPGYRPVMAAIKRGRTVAEIASLFGGPVKLVAARVEGLDLVVLDAPHLFDRPGGLYTDATGQDWSDNWRRFAALSRVGAWLAGGLVEGYRPQVLHAHDWQAALAAAYVAFDGNTDTRTVVTVHNLAFQGRFGADIFPALGLPDASFDITGVEYYGGVGFLKGGLRCAHAVTTVSPTYAKEIRTAAFGMGLEGLLAERASDLYGIINGIDTTVWNPSQDAALAATYGATNTRRRQINKAALEERFGLEPGPGLLVGLISRLTWQKGIDIVAETADGLVAAGGRLAVIGSGEPELEAAMVAAAARHPGKVGFVRAYDEPLSHLIQGGADAILVPSRFEPCGLTQLYGLRYGAVPIVSRVGGLADTVIDANAAAIQAGVATGIQFGTVDADGLLDAYDRTLALYRQPQIWGRMQRKGMKTDVSWENSAAAYAALYDKLVNRGQP